MHSTGDYIMRRFKIYTGRYGGELTIGRISQELFDNLKYADEDVIIENFDGWDSDLAWHDIDDIEHITGPFADNEYDVFEVNSEDEEIAEVGRFRYNGLYAREAYLYDISAHAARPEGAPAPITPELQPVLHFFSEEKGGFGEVYIETEGDFDPAKLCIGTVETDLAEIIDEYYYDGKQVEPDLDFCDTVGKGYYAKVGAMNMEWHDNRSNYGPDSEFVKEALEYYEE